MQQLSTIIADFFSKNEQTSGISRQSLCQTMASSPNPMCVVFLKIKTVSWKRYLPLRRAQHDILVISVLPFDSEVDGHQQRLRVGEAGFLGGACLTLGGDLFFSTEPAVLHRWLRLSCTPTQVYSGKT